VQTTRVRSALALCTTEERRKAVPPPLIALRGAHAAGWLSWLVLSWLRALCAVRSSAARIAIAVGSSIRSGRPFRSRERRASCAPALRISARSSGLSGRDGGLRTSRLLALGALTSFRSGLVGVLSVVGHHLPETTRRSGHHLRSAARKSGWGGNDSHRVQPRAISPCNQILTVRSERQGSRRVIVHGICLCLRLARVCT
jgi:hypothetical protein